MSCYFTFICKHKQTKETRIINNLIKIKGKEKHIWFLETKKLSRKYSLAIALTQKIYNLCCLGFGQEENGGFKQDVTKHIMGEERICLVFKQEIRLMAPSNLKESSVLCFISYRTLSIKETKIVYFSGVVVDPEFQGQGIASTVMEKIMKREGAEWGVLRTQNPVMRESLKKICLEVFPSLSGDNPPAQFMAIGHHIAEILGMTEYNNKEMTEKNTYSNSLYGNSEIPILKDNPTLNGAFMAKVKTYQGDSMIVVGKRNIGEIP